MQDKSFIQRVVENADTVMEFEGTILLLVKRDLYSEVIQPYYCGYVIFDGHPFPEDGYGGIMYAIPVHEITYGEYDGEYSIYGFDCAHIWDFDNPDTKNPEWLINQCKRMKVGIEVAGELHAKHKLSIEDWHVPDYIENKLICLLVKRDDVFDDAYDFDQLDDLSYLFKVGLIDNPKIRWEYQKSIFNKLAFWKE
jgi:hypothetical protein